MSTEYSRKLLDIINENSQPKVQLDEGLLDTVKAKVGQMVGKLFKPEELQHIKSTVEKVLGKPAGQISFKDLNKDTAVALAKSLGAGPQTQVNEGVLDFLNKTKVDPKSGKGTLAGIDAWHKSATLGEKLISLGSAVGGIGGLAGAFLGGLPGWVIIPSFLALLITSQIGTEKGGSV